MQTPAERFMVQTIACYLNSRQNSSDIPRVLNVGAGQSTSIEQQLNELGCRYACDRIDVENCRVDFSPVGECWQCSVTDMQPVQSSHYLVAFGNYVLEHVDGLEKASQEAYRVLVPGGCFAATIPNVLAPEFVLARHTPLWFHGLVRKGAHVWETEYAYRSVPELITIFVDNGFQVESEGYWPLVQGYLYQFPILNTIGRLYDQLISICDYKRFMGQACIVLKKPG